MYREGSPANNLTYSCAVTTINFHLIYSVSKAPSGIHGYTLGCHYTKLRDNYCYRRTLIAREHRRRAHNSGHGKNSAYTLYFFPAFFFFIHFSSFSPLLSPHAPFPSPRPFHRIPHPRLRNVDRRYPSRIIRLVTFPFDLLRPVRPVLLRS